MPLHAAGLACRRRCFLVIVLLVFFSGCSRQATPAVPTGTTGRAITATPQHVTPQRPTPAPSALVSPVPTFRPLPTPSITPFLLPASCSESQLAGLTRQFVMALNAGDAEQLYSLLASPQAEDEWFAVIPRDVAQLSTAVFTTNPDDFTRYALARHTQNEQIAPLELVDMRGRGAVPNTALVMLAAVRQATDVPAKPVVLLFVIDCLQGRIRGLTLTDAPVTTVPQTPVQLLNTALRQRPVEVAEGSTKGSLCPRSAWAFGRAVGTSPAYVDLGPDAVVNLGGPLAQSDETGGYTFPLIWHLAPGYHGPLLIRGMQLDGDGSVLFAAGEGQSGAVAGLLLLPQDLVSQGGGWTSWRLQGKLGHAGCYALLVDGVVFHQTIVFLAVDGAAEQIAELSSAQPLPNALQLLSALQTGPSSVQLALASEQLVLRLVQSRSPILSAVTPSPSQCQESVVGLVCWSEDPTSGWPATASWNDGAVHYQLVTLQATASTWTASDLVALAQALHKAHLAWRNVSPTP